MVWKCTFSFAGVAAAVTRQTAGEYWLLASLAACTDSRTFLLLTANKIFLRYFAPFSDMHHVLIRLSRIDHARQPAGRPSAEQATK